MHGLNFELTLSEVSRVQFFLYLSFFTCQRSKALQLLIIALSHRMHKVYVVVTLFGHGWLEMFFDFFS